MKPQISTVEFESSHGKAPRGIGYWAFATTRNPQPENIYWFAGSYATAKKVAQLHFKGATVVYVLS